MHRRAIYFFILSLFLIQTGDIKAQQLPKVSGTYNNALIQDLFLDLEKQTNFYFYYDPVQIDSVFTSIGFDNMELDSVLSNALRGMSLRFSIDKAEKKVYITEQIDLITSLPRDFLAPPGSLADEHLPTSRPDTKKRMVQVENFVHEIGNKNIPPPPAGGFKRGGA